MSVRNRLRRPKNSRIVGSRPARATIKPVRADTCVDTDLVSGEFVLLATARRPELVRLRSTITDAQLTYFMHSILSWNATVLQQHAAGRCSGRSVRERKEWGATHKLGRHSYRLACSGRSSPPHLCAGDRQRRCQTCAGGVKRHEH